MLAEGMQRSRAALGALAVIFVAASCGGHAASSSGTGAPSNAAASRPTLPAALTAHERRSTVAELLAFKASVGTMVRRDQSCIAIAEATSSPVRGNCVGHAIIPLIKASALLNGTLGPALDRFNHQAAVDPADPCVVGVLLVYDAIRRELLVLQRYNNDLAQSSTTTLQVDFKDLGVAIQRISGREPNLITGCALAASG